MNLYVAVRKGLDERGFLPMTKHVVLRGLGMALMALVIGMICMPFDRNDASRLMWFGAAGLVSVWNFFALASHVHQNIAGGWGKIFLKLCFSTQLRLFLTGFLVYGVYRCFGAPLIPIFIGLALPLLCIVLSFCLPRG